MDNNEQNNGQNNSYDYNPNDQYYYPNGQPFNQVPNGQEQAQQNGAYSQQPNQQYQNQQYNQAPNQQYNQYQNPNQGQPYNPNNGSSDGTATGALVCGIISVIPCCWGLLGAILGIVAIVLYVSNKDKVSESARGKLKAGFICGIIGVVLAVLSTIGYFVLGGLDAFSGISRNMYY